MEFPTHINWTSLLPLKGFLGIIFHFYSNYNRTFCKQAVETQIGRHPLSRLIWVCTFCLCLQKGRFAYITVTRYTASFIELSVAFNLDAWAPITDGILADSIKVNKCLF